MKFKHILPLAVAAVPFLLSARPASPRLATMTNPDGTKVDLYFRGNADFSFALSADESTIYEKDANGFWVPASRNGRVLTPNEDNIALLRSERPGAYMNIAPTGCGHTVSKPSSPFPGAENFMAALDETGRSTFPTLAQDIHGLVVLLEYADTPFSWPNINAMISDLCNKEGYDDFGSRGSAKDYFEASSKGQFSPTFDVYGPVKLQYGSVYYNGKGTNLYGAGHNARFGVAIKEALDYLDANTEIDFSKYDYDQDGKIDNIFFFFSGFGQADSHDDTTVWPHQGEWSRYEQILKLPKLIYDGVEMTCYACSCELNAELSTPNNPWLDGIGAFCHEFSHVLGLPDHYDVNGGTTTTPGYWDIMSNGSYNNHSTCPPFYNAQERWLVRWEEYIEAEEGKTYTLEAPTSGQPNSVRVSIPKQAGGVYPEYFVLESRKKASWDEFLPGDPGMMVWHVNYNAGFWAKNEVNTNGVSRFEIVKINDRRGKVTFPASGSDYLDYIYPYGDVALKTVITSRIFRPFITDITYDDETGRATFEYNTITEPVQDQPVITRLYRDDSPYNRILYFEWDPIDGIDTYLVSVSYNTANGYTQYLNSYNRARVNDTKCTVRNINEKAWGSEVTIKVEPFKKVPGENPAVTTCVPENLVTNSAVEEIDLNDVQIFGDYGCIVAPRGAEAFNLQGVSTGLDNLVPGLYIVRYQGKTAKVIVK